MLCIIPGDFDDPRVVALLEHHHRTMHAQTPKGSAHALDLKGLRNPSIRFWTVWEDDMLAGMGALKALDRFHGEVKSMRTVEGFQRKGIAGSMLRHIIGEAKSSGITRLSLETGSFALFVPAVALYRKHGFVASGPFGDYRPDPNSVFLMLDLMRR